MNRLLLIILLNSFLGISQTNNESIFYNGVELYNQGEYQKAISQFELIIEAEDAEEEASWMESGPWLQAMVDHAILGRSE